MPDSSFLAFDLGAESGRAMLGTLSAGRLTLEEKHRFANPSGRINGHLHWDLLAQWEQLKIGLRNAAANGTKIDGIGVDTWGIDFGLIGHGGEILGNPYMYRDSRNDGVMERTFARVSREEIFQLTGIQFMQINSLYQLIAYQEQGGIGGEGSSMLRAAETLLFMPDLFNYLFTGIRKCEHTITSTSQMYDPRHKQWAKGLLERLQLPTKILADIVPAGTVLGPLREDVAAECSANRIPVIAPATHDTASAVAAVPAEGADWCYISSGTWSLMGVELPEPIINADVLRHNFTNEGGVGGTIRFLKNIMGLWPLQECRREWQKQAADLGYDEITRLATAAPTLGPLLNLDDHPFLSPGDMPAKIAAFCRRTRQPIPTGPGEIARSILESLALSYRQTIEGIEEILGRKIKTIHIVGGGSRNELLNQMTADACGRTVVAGPIEATAIGNVLVQAMAMGMVKDVNEIRAIVRNSFPVKRFEPRETGKWDGAYARFRELVTPCPQRP